MTHFSHLVSPITIGSMTSSNRLLMSAMSINFGVDDSGFVTEQLTEYFVARARGGAGMMLVGGGGVHPTGLELPRLPALWDDGCIPALARMTRRMREFDVRFGMQLMHGGRQSYHDQKVAPSPIPAPAVVKGVPRELTLEGIREMGSAFGDAARRCRDGGFDFVEVHAAHGYLINQFYAPNSNKRQDAYGGSFENRIRFLLEVVQDIQDKTGPDYPLGIRINGNDYIQDGWTLADALRLAVILEKKGVAYLHVSAGVYGSTELTIPSMYAPHGCFVHLAEAVKQKVSVPVITVGRIKHADLADRIIREGRADVVSMGRALIADPDRPQKARTGRIKQIRPCIGCCLGCIHAVLQLGPGGGVVNPDVGREFQLGDLAPADPPRRILVIGAGPAGLSAARILALRGHRVTICEGSGDTGGLMQLAARAPGRGEVLDIIRFFQSEISRLKVEVRLNAPVSLALIADIGPDDIVLATGSLPEMPIIKGLFNTRIPLTTVTDILSGEAVAGDHAAIIGGTQAALMCADFLAEKGHRVSVLNRKRHFAEEMSANDRYYLRERLKRDSVRLYKQVTVKQVGDAEITFTTGSETQTLTPDTIVISEKMTAIRDAGEIARTRGVPCHIIGDAKNPRILMHAISEGEELGRVL